jgi:hypothetical protein
MSTMPLTVIAYDPHLLFGEANDGPCRWVIYSAEGGGEDMSTTVLAVSTTPFASTALALRDSTEVASAISHGFRIIAANGHVIDCGVVGAGAFNVSQETGELTIIAAGAFNTPQTESEGDIIGGGGGHAAG